MCYRNQYFYINAEFLENHTRNIVWLLFIYIFPPEDANENCLDQEGTFRN